MELLSIVNGHSKQIGEDILQGKLIQTIIPHHTAREKMANIARHQRKALRFCFRSCPASNFSVSHHPTCTALFYRPLLRAWIFGLV